MSATIQPWHREAASDCANSPDLIEIIAERIADHDPAASDRELLKECERALEYYELLLQDCSKRATLARLRARLARKEAT